MATGKVEVRASRLRHWGAREALRLLGGVALATALVGLTLAFTAGANVAIPVAIGIGYAGVLVGGITAAVKAARPVADAPATVRATAEGLFVDGALVAARAEISSSGTVVPETVIPPIVGEPWSAEHGPPMLRLARKGALTPAVEIRVASVEEGREPLAALELDAAHAVGIAKVRSPFIGYSALAYALTCFGGGLMGMLPRGATLAAAGVGLAVAFVASLVSMMTPMTVVVGTDGVALRWIGWKRFIPMSEIRAVFVAPLERSTVVLELTNGDKQRLVFRGGRGRSIAARAAEVEAATLKERIDEAMGVGAQPGAADAQALARGDRSIAEWVAQLRLAMRGEGTFREAPIVPERLWRVLENTRADLAKRAAAAVALGAELDEPGRERLRVAAASTASPRLRVAFEAALDDDAERATEALASLEASESETEASSDGNPVR